MVAPSTTGENRRSFLKPAQEGEGRVGLPDSLPDRPSHHSICLGRRWHATSARASGLGKSSEEVVKIARIATAAAMGLRPMRARGHGAKDHCSCRLNEISNDLNLDKARPRKATASERTTRRWSQPDRTKNLDKSRARVTPVWLSPKGTSGII